MNPICVANVNQERCSDDKNITGVNYKSSVNEQWDKKKKMMGITDDEISNTTLYQVDYQDGSDLDKNITGVNYKSSVNGKWDKKKKMMGIAGDEISNAKLYQVDY